MFDESCEHRATVSADAGSPRVVLIADIANPLLADPELYLETLLPPPGGHLGNAAPAHRRAALLQRYTAAQAKVLAQLRHQVLPRQAPGRHADGEL